MLNRRIAALICFVLLSPLILVYCPETASAEDIVVVKTWYGEDGLAEWMAKNPAGGTVALGADIELSGNIDYYLSAGNWVTIETRQFSIIVKDWALLSMGGHVRLEGEGVDKPVLTIGNEGKLYISGSNEVIATGENGVALCLEGGARYSYYHESRPYFCAKGAGSTAIVSAIELPLEWHTLEAPGTGARGIDCSERVSLYFCRVDADGDAVVSPDVTLDTCAVSPSVPNAKAINRRISKIMPTFSGIYTYEVGTLVELAGKTIFCSIFLRDERNIEDDKSVNIWVEFGGEDRIYDSPGIYSIPVTLRPPLDVFDIVPKDKPPGMDIIVYDPKLPFFNHAKRIIYDDYDYYSLSYLYSGESLSLLTLWRSDDDGASWRISWRQGFGENEPFDVRWSGGEITLDYRLADIIGEVLFAFEVEGSGGSHVVKLVADDIWTAGTTGGDRDGGDRLPWSMFLGTPNENVSPGGEVPQNPSENNGNGNEGGGSAAVWMVQAPDPNIILEPSEVENGGANDSPSSRGGGNGYRTGSPMPGQSTSPMHQPKDKSLSTAEENIARRNSTATGGRRENTDEDAIAALSNRNPKQSGGMSPYTAVATGVLGAGGAGGLAYTFRNRLIKRRR